MIEFVRCCRVRNPLTYTHSLWSSMHLTSVHITAQSYKAATVIETYAVAFDFVRPGQSCVDNNSFLLKCSNKTTQREEVHANCQKSIYFKLKEMLRNTTNKSMRSTDKMRNCHLMEWDGDGGLLLADQINKTYKYITLLKNTALSLSLIL